MLRPHTCTPGGEFGVEPSPNLGLYGIRVTQIQRAPLLSIADVIRFLHTLLVAQGDPPALCTFRFYEVSDDAARVEMASGSLYR